MRERTYYEYAFIVTTKERETWIYFKALSDSDARLIGKGILSAWNEENEKAKYGNLYAINTGEPKRLVG